MSTDTTIEMDQSILAGFLEESKEALGGLDSLFVALEKTPDDLEVVNSIFRPVHSIKGNAPFFGLLRLKTLAHEFESLLAALRAKKILPSPALFDLLLAGIDEIKAVLERVGNGQPEVGDQRQFEGLIERAKAATAGALDSSASVPSAAEVAPAEQEAKSVSAKTETVKSMRVPEERIDTFLSFVGELIVAQDMLRHFTTKIEASQVDLTLIRDLGTINSVISTLGAGLERAIMSIRKVPVRALLQKAPRLVRDIAASKGKQIEVEIKGDEIEIDKSLVELLDAPITHMVRNAADHGIEAPEKRNLSGKQSKGTVSITCEELANDIVITIADDGAGLNYEGLTKKALALKMISAGEKLSETQVINLIFMAGVSTAQEVSEISGRGVGMDVVKRNIESAGGSIAVTSTPGKGCKFALKLPKSVTTQIMQGFVVESAGINFVLPLEKVHESWCLKKVDITNVVKGGPCVRRHDRMLPVVDLAKLLGEVSTHAGDESHLVVTIDVDQKKLALFVDNVIGPRQLVLKPLEEISNQSKYFLGGALLGNGDLALVLDVAKMVH